MTDKDIQDQIKDAVAFQALKSSVDFMSGQLTELSSNMKSFTQKTETNEIKENFNEHIKQIKEGFFQHNIDDKDSFSALKKQNEDNKKFIWMAVGGITAISFMMQLVAPTILKFLKIG